MNRTRRVYAAVATAACLAAPAAFGDTISLFVFAGQSNLNGRFTRNTAADLIARDARYATPNPNVDYNFRINLENKPGGWGPLFHHEGFQASTWGPDVVFGYELNDRDPSLDFAVIKTAINGTSLSDDWDDDNTDPGARQLFDDSVGFIQSQIADLELSTGKTVVVEGVFWLQGWNDTATLAQGQEYGANLAALAEDFRQEFANPELPFIFTRQHINTLPDGEDSVANFGNVYDSVLAMRAGQEAFAASDPNAYLIDIDDVGFFVEPGLAPGGADRTGVHYDTDGLIAIGERFVNTWQAIPTPGSAVLLTTAGAVVAFRRRRAA